MRHKTSQIVVENTDRGSDGEEITLHEPAKLREEEKIRNSISSVNIVSKNGFLFIKRHHAAD